MKLPKTSLHPMLYGKYKAARSCLDYSYHKMYSKERQYLQDAIIEQVLIGKPMNVEQPRLYLTAGAMGAGKTHTVKRLLKEAKGKEASFDTFVLACVDRIKLLIPEMQLLLKTDPVNAGSRMHSEACTIHEILFRTALMHNMNVIIDGSLRNGDFFESILESWQGRQRYTITIVHVIASLETCLRRAKKRAEETGRYVPKDSIVKTIEQCPKSVEQLSPFVDVVKTVNND